MLACPSWCIIPQTFPHKFRSQFARVRLGDTMCMFWLRECTFAKLHPMNSVQTSHLTFCLFSVCCIILFNIIYTCKLKATQQFCPVVVLFISGFKNNNDDQTAFSLLFKLHGFRAFSVEERDQVVYTGRNLAKFIKDGVKTCCACIIYIDIPLKTYAYYIAHCNIVYMFLWLPTLIVLQSNLLP